MIQQFAKARQEFIDAVERFPKDKRAMVLFDRWSLKEILTHIAGWDNCIANNIICIKKNQEPPHYGKVDDFNKNSVEKGRRWNWERAYKEFIKGGELIVREYGSLPEALWDKKFWPTKNSTPRKFLQIVTHHYLRDHLPEIRKTIFL